MTEDTETEDVEAEAMEGETTFSEIMDFANSVISEEEAEIEGDVPDTSDALIVKNATELMEAIQHVKVAQELETAEEFTDEQIQDHVGDAAVNILFALATVEREYGVDIEDAFEAKKERIEMVRNAEDTDDLMEQVIENMDEDVEMEDLMGGETEADNVAFQ